MIGVGISISEVSARTRPAAEPGPIPSVVGVGTPASGNVLAPTLSPGLPGGWAAGMGLLVLTECNFVDTIPEPEGFTELPNSGQGVGSGSTTKLQVFGARATEDQEAPVVTRVGDHTLTIVLAIEGITEDGDFWSETAGDGGTGTAITIPGLNTSIPNSLILDLLSNGIDSSVGNRLSLWANADLADPAIAEIPGLDICSDAGGGGGLAGASGGRAEPGLISETTATMNSSSEWGVLKIAIKPLNT